MESISISTAQQNLRVHYINVVDLFKLQPSSEHPHGLPDRDFDSLFTADRPIIFNNMPMGLAINNEIDRFTVAIEVIDRTPKLLRIGARVKEQYRDGQTGCRNYPYKHGIDKPDIVGWRWPY